MSNICQLIIRNFYLQKSIFAVFVFRTQLIIRNFYLQKSIFAVFVFRTPVGDRRGCRGCDSKAKIVKTE